MYSQDYIIEDIYVYKVEKDRDSIFSKSFVGMTVKIVVTGAKTDLNMGEVLPIQVEYRDWQDNPLPDIVTPVFVTVKHSGDEPATLTLTPTDGKAEFDFISNAKGAFSINFASVELGCDSAVFNVEVK
ncbi:hypothetical protein GJ688_12725 [Heliobacillus mobilis]|uniref:Big-1 domain-containing protein n=1 Tax=Heliobacterium mobile TaxID=28064 RepID=A0A6I3SM41_HELMO|nr:hypothetical protein [Heliobacterium mobile]MTV49836.1 hypothetical protein [Heliobacterium mobile]